ncbi:amidohydrolase family protein [Ilumatobacter sp.]|uniref:N-acyl-D-amino-acid deacylase family protein n=1 Tax=Ilumatobacter sp. TaxID=1967498 RepID=UPI0037511CF0
MFDLIIRNATLIDGTGAPARPGDIGISDGLITAVGDVAADALTERSIDATGRVVCPGFIDIHTHSDLTLVADGTGESKLRQGVTTEVVGNCSFAAFPIEPKRLDLHVDHLARATAPITPWWTDFDGYADALHEQGLAINVAPLAGHGTLRVAAMGVDNRPATADELSRMESDLDHALEQGAFGMSTGLTHVPSSYGDFDEVAALARVLAARGALYATHCRAIAPDERASVAEAIDIGRQTGVTVEFSHLAINRPDRWGHGTELLAMFDEAREEGIDIFFDVYPYAASSSSLTQYLPPWLQAGGTEAMRARLANPDDRRQAIDDMAEGWFGGIPWLWDRFLVSSCPDGYGIAQTLEALSTSEGIEPYELTLQLCERYGNEMQVVLFYRDEDDVAKFLAHPLSVIGSDGNAIPLDQPTACPHPRNFGTFPRVLGVYARDKAVLELVDAVNKMTAEPARRLGMTDRGTLSVGTAADLVMFNPETVIDNSEFGQDAAPPTGIDVVVVGGRVMLDHGTISTDRPGRVLRRAPRSASV